MHGCHPNGTDMPGHRDCLPTFLRFGSQTAPLLAAVETRGGDVRVPQAGALLACRVVETDVSDARGRLMAANASWQIPASYFRYRMCSCPDVSRPTSLSDLWFLLLICVAAGGREGELAFEGDFGGVLRGGRGARERCRPADPDRSRQGKRLSPTTNNATGSLSLSLSHNNMPQHENRATARRGRRRAAPSGPT